MGLRILHVYKDYYPVLGGMENHIKMLAESQVQRGHEVTVLVTHPTSRTHVEDINGVRVIKAGRLATVASAPLSLSLPAWLLRQTADIAHLHFPYPIGEVSQLLFGKAKRAVMTYHSDVVRQRGLLRLYRPLLWQILLHMDRIIATSSNYVASSAYLSRVADRCTIVPLGIELKRFLAPSTPAVQCIRQRYGSPLLLFVGKLRYYKGLQYLLQAMPELTEATSGQSPHLLVVGSGPMETEWHGLARNLGLAGRVTFLGEVSDEDLPSYYHASDLFVLPASERSEAFGTVQIEAMASGVPVVCTELGTGTSFVNVHGQTGWVVPARDSTALVQGIRSLLRDPEQMQRMAQAARARAVAEFSLETMVDRVLAVYLDVLKRQDT
jgi:glycosyltransferase involved in cell wall biosynthesis